MITDTIIPAISPADGPSDESLILVLVIASKKASNTSLDVMLIIASGLSSRVIHMHVRDITHWYSIHL